MHDVEDVDRIAANFRSSDCIISIAGDLNVERLFDNVDDFIDKQTHRLSAKRDHKNGMNAVRARHVGRSRKHRHQPALVHCDERTVGLRQAIAGDTFDARHKGEWKGFERSGTGAEQDEPRAFKRRPR